MISVYMRVSATCKYNTKLMALYRAAYFDALLATAAAVYMLILTTLFTEITQAIRAHSNKLSLALNTYWPTVNAVQMALGEVSISFGPLHLCGN